VSFDDPHLRAGTVLQGEYPASLIQWASGSWQISAPAGAFGSFHLLLAGGAGRASFRFLSAQMLVGVDAYNPGPGEAQVSLQCSGGPAYRATLPVGRVQRLRTGWQQPCTEVSVEPDGAGALHFDNLAYAPADAATESGQEN
jgi:hypothetical protein